MILILLYDSAVRVSELLSLDVQSVNLEAAIPYIRVCGKGDKERIIALTDMMADHLKEYMKVYHPEKEACAPLIYTVIKGSRDRMSVGNIERIVKNMQNRYVRNIRISPKAATHIWSVGQNRQICTGMGQSWN